MTKDDEQTRLLSEILKWIRFAGMKGVKDVLLPELDTDEKRWVYQLSDGTKAIAEIKKITGVSSGTISKYWKKWLKLGLGETKAVRRGDRFVRSFDLEDFGVNVPEIKANQNAENNNMKNEG